VTEGKTSARTYRRMPRQHVPSRVWSEDETASSPAEAEHVTDLRALARLGRLAATAAAAPPAVHAQLSAAAYTVTWPIVFARLTRPIERRRGHNACAISVFRMADDCLDRFYDDVEAVVEHLLLRSGTPISNLEAWITARLNAATVDGYRRRRGRVGALQRPRLPKWLSHALNEDPWLTDLATQILLWVGVPATAGTELWPYDAWAVRRAEVVDGSARMAPGLLAREIEFVLATMRTHREWYENYVERPLGHKRPPVVGPTGVAELPPLLLAGGAGGADSHLADLAAGAIQAIQARLRRGQDATAVVTDVVRSVFGMDIGGATAAPDYQHQVDALLGDAGRVARVVETVLRIVAQPAAPDAPASSLLV
jgi:hypothetical protein